MAADKTATNRFPSAEMQLPEHLQQSVQEKAHLYDFFGQP
jgi:hypothetical protein